MRTVLALLIAASTAVAQAPAGYVIADQRPPVPEIKYRDLYCSGFVRKAALPLNLKVIARYDATGGVLAAEPSKKGEMVRFTIPPIFFRI